MLEMKRASLHVQENKIARAMAKDPQAATDILVEFGLRLEEGAEDFVSWVREYADAKQSQRNALKALAGLILKGCEA